MPLVNSPWATLDPIFVETIALMRKAENLLSDEAGPVANDSLQSLKQEAELLREDYQKSVIHFCKEWRPTVVGTIPRCHGTIR